MSHFEQILKMIGLMKTFAIKCDAHVTQQSGNVTSLVIAFCVSSTHQLRLHYDVASLWRAGNHAACLLL